MLDEATAMLDPRGREEVLSTVRKLNRERGMAVVRDHAVHGRGVGRGSRIRSLRRTARHEGTPKEVFNERALLEESRLESRIGGKLRDELIAAGLPVSHEAMACDALADELSRTFHS